MVISITVEAMPQAKRNFHLRIWPRELQQWQLTLAHRVRLTNVEEVQAQLPLYEQQQARTLNLQRNSKGTKPLTRAIDSKVIIAIIYSQRTVQVLSWAVIPSISTVLKPATMQHCETPISPLQTLPDWEQYQRMLQAWLSAPPNQQTATLTNGRCQNMMFEINK